VLRRGSRRSGWDGAPLLHGGSHVLGSETGAARRARAEAGPTGRAVGRTGRAFCGARRCAQSARREARGGPRFIRMRLVRMRTVSVVCVAMLEFDWIIQKARERKGFSFLCLSRETYQIIRRYDAPC